MQFKAAALLLTLALMSACGRVVPPTIQVKPPVATSAVRLGVRRGPALASLFLTPISAANALKAFSASCPRLMLRKDASGLTTPADWAPVCRAAATWPQGDARGFFTNSFETAQIGSGTTYITGYFEPEIFGSREQSPQYPVPIYRLPTDLVRAKVGDAPPNPDGHQPLGRYDANGLFVPYWDRAQIEAGALAGQGLEIAWAADPVELFFMQVQGSGRLRMFDGTIMRIGYGGENGYAYTGIGSVMNAQGLIGDGPGQYRGSMQGIELYIRDHPEAGRALMDQNRSYIFFRDTTAIAGDPDTGPVGALSVPVTPRVTLAADPAFVPLGAPVFLTTDRADVGGLWVAQDTGGAIKGANRFDSFWGTGTEGRRIAGGMSARGQALVLLPRGVLARIIGPGTTGK